MATATELMERLGQKIAGREDLKAAVGAVYKFVLDGDGGGTFVLDMKSSLTVSSGDGPAGCTVRMAAADFVELFEGRANGQALFFSGKLRVEGDMALALKLQALTDVLR